jgi:SAM-dependent methyltransferase
MGAEPARAFVPESAVIDVDTENLRDAIREEYRVVAEDPSHGFHFHTGRRLTEIVGYEPEWLKGVPETAIESFAGTGCPFRMGELAAGERVVDIGCGAGIDSLISAKMVGSDGAVIGVDMTPAMIEKARRAVSEGRFDNVEIRNGLMEALPAPDGWADVVISNGVFNLAPDKSRVLDEMDRVLAPGGRLQIADILVARSVSTEAKQKIDLWTG